MFWQLLLVFPVVGLLFGGGQLASAIVLIAGTNNTIAANDGAYTLGKNDPNDQSVKCVTLPSSNPNAGPGERDAKVAGCGVGSTPLLLGLVAAGIAVAPLFAVWSVLKGALAAAGTIGGKVGGTIQTLGDKAGRGARKPEDWAKRAAGKAMLTGAYGNKYTRPVAGLGRRLKRHGELGDAKLKARQSAYDATGGANQSGRIAAAQAAESASKIAAQKQFADKFGKNKDYAGNMLGSLANNPDIQNALITQSESAKKQAQDDVERRLDSSNLKGLEDALVEAVRRGSEIEARAIQSALWKSGAAGQERFHSAAKTIVQNNYDPTGGMADALRKNGLANHPGYKSDDYVAGKWSETRGAGFEELANITADKMKNMTAAKFAGLSSFSQGQVASQIPASVKVELTQANNAQLLARIDPGARRTLGI